VEASHFELVLLRKYSLWLLAPTCIWFLRYKALESSLNSPSSKSLISDNFGPNVVLENECVNITRNAFRLVLIYLILPVLEILRSALDYLG
jgi:hypothetical protein